MFPCGVYGTDYILEAGMIIYDRDVSLLVCAFIPILTQRHDDGLIARRSRQTLYL